MAAEEEVVVTCRFCGEIRLSQSELACSIPAPTAPLGICEARCPYCSRPVLVPVPSGRITTLLAEGASPIRGAVPFELLEPHAGLPISWDDVLDGYLAVEDSCCPQEEVAA